MNRFIQKPTKLLFAILLFSVAAMSQMPTRAVPAAPPPQEDFTWWYISIFVLFIALAGAVGFWYKKKYGLSEGPSAESGNGEVDVDAELAWLKSVSKKKKGKSKNYPKGLPRTSRVLNKDDISSIKDGTGRSFDETKKKLQQIQFDKLPVNRFDDLNEPKHFDALPISNDDALMSAIEQTHCEDEEDPEIREVSIRILARFRTRNSIEALEQVAKYDVSSSLRSKAVAILAEFDHESVFETILLCGADPTREVRAAAARALFQLSFDRADAWARIANCGDEFRMVQAARAAIESDLVERSIERLIHEDLNHSYEAFALIALLIRAGETMEIFQILESHADQFVKLALLRVFKVIQDERTIPMLYSYMERNTLPELLGKAVNDCIKSADLVPA